MRIVGDSFLELNPVSLVNSLERTVRWTLAHPYWLVI